MTCQLKYGRIGTSINIIATSQQVMLPTLCNLSIIYHHSSSRDTVGIICHVANDHTTNTHTNTHTHTQHQTIREPLQRSMCQWEREQLPFHHYRIEMEDAKK